MFEVELKYRVENREDILQRLNALQCRFESPISQSDLYFAHPARDFAATDEALRLRRTGAETCITYKGPKLDPVAKIRREIELPIAGGESGFLAYRELLAVLGFREVREVRKDRLPGTLPWLEENVTVALDCVAELGDFIELELLAPESGLSSAKEKLLSLATLLQLSQPERRGYLQLLGARA